MEITGPNVIKGTQSFSAASWSVSIQRDVLADVFIADVFIYLIIFWEGSKTQ